MRSQQCGFLSARSWHFLTPVIFCALTFGPTTTAMAQNKSPGPQEAFAEKYRLLQEANQAVAGNLQSEAQRIIDQHKIPPERESKMTLNERIRANEAFIDAVGKSYHQEDGGASVTAMRPLENFEIDIPATIAALVQQCKAGDWYVTRDADGNMVEQRIKKDPKGNLVKDSSGQFEIHTLPMGLGLTKDTVSHAQDPCSELGDKLKAPAQTRVLRTQPALTSSSAQPAASQTPPVKEESAASSSDKPLRGQPPPVTAGWSTVRGNDYVTVVSNHSNSAITAYALAITVYAGNTLRHFYDARIVGRPSIKPGAAFVEPRRDIVVGVRVLAAVFADGTFFGDPKHVADLMERRRVKLTALAGAVSILCDAQAKGSDLQIVVGALENRKSQFGSSGTARAAGIQTEAYTAVIEKVKRDSLQGSDAFGNALRFLQTSVAPLLEDPVRDPSGQLYLKETPALLSCAPDSASSATSSPRPAPKPYSAHPMIALRDGFYVRTGLPTDRWPNKPERVLRVSVAGNEIIVVEISRDAPAGAAPKERPIFHGTYISNPFLGDWGGSHVKMPMAILSPERFLFGTEGLPTDNYWNRLSDTAAR
jgi:hypothetical protein